MEPAKEPKRGRPRNASVHEAILKAALQLVSAKGFRAITVDQIAAKAGIGKMTLYRRWPNKSAVVMDALLELIGPETEFPPAPSALDSLQVQLRLQARFFRSKYGRLICSLLAEAQSDEELAKAFRERWIYPRRRGVIRILQKAVEENALRPGIDLEAATDLLYGPIYYRLLLGTGSLDDAFLQDLFVQFLKGHQR